MGRALPVLHNDLARAPGTLPPRGAGPDERGAEGGAEGGAETGAEGGDCSAPARGERGDEAPRGPERKDAVRNRKKILEAAKKLMRTRGLADVCMDELAAAAGVGKGTLYRRFTDKHALFRALLDEDETVLQEAARARFGLARDAAPPLRLMTTWAAFVDFVVDHADVLAAAEAEAKQATLCDSPPWRWRHIELVRHLTACGVADGRAAMLADAWLSSLGADVVRRALAQAGVDEVKAAWRALPVGVLGGLVDAGVVGEGSSS